MSLDRPVDPEIAQKCARVKDIYDSLTRQLLEVRVQSEEGQQRTIIEFNGKTYSIDTKLLSGQSEDLTNMYQGLTKNENMLFRSLDLLETLIEVIEGRLEKFAIMTEDPEKYENDLKSSVEDSLGKLLDKINLEPYAFRRIEMITGLHVAIKKLLD